MIYTNLKDTLQNKNVAKKVQECIEYTNKNLEELKKLDAGAYDIDLGIKMHVNAYETGTEEDKIMETHLKNLDVQIMLCGEEYVAFNTSNNMKVEKTEEEKDFLTNTMVPTMLVGGFTTVTLGSVVFAGILTNFL